MRRMKASFLRRIWTPVTISLRTYCIHTSQLGYDGLNGLDAVVSYICAYMRKQGHIETDLLLIDNPVSGEVVKKFERAGVKKIACTIKEEDHFMNIQNQLTESHHVFHHHLLHRHKQESKLLFNTIKSEADILASVGNVSRLVILASSISDVENISIHFNLVNRVMTREMNGFNSLRNIDWFMALPQKYVTLKKHLDSNHTVIKLLNSYYSHQNGIKISYNDCGSIFYDNLVPKKDDKKYKNARVNFERKIADIKSYDVQFMHFVPKLSVLQEFNLEERMTFQTFVRAVNGPHRLIPALEKLVPGCGLGLIELGYGMADEAQKIKGNEFIKLYKDVKSLPEFEGSALDEMLSGKDNVENPHFDVRYTRNW